MSVVHVVAILTTRPGKREEVLAALNEKVPNVLAEEGCIEYGATIDALDAGSIQTALGPDIFVAIEKWESVNHLKAHAETPHMATFGKKVKDLMAGRVVHVLSPS
jgi:quinol monooxygenase YgiN